eukprot:3342687-Pleurochrysis_carterae.AAC.2
MSSYEVLSPYVIVVGTSCQSVGMPMRNDSDRSERITKTNRRDGARPTTIMGRGFLDTSNRGNYGRASDDYSGSGLASPSTLVPTITLPLSTGIAEPRNYAANGRGDYGRAYYEGSVWIGSLLITTKPATSGAHHYT